MRHRRSIRAAFRVQCGKCDGWMSVPEDYKLGTDLPSDMLTVRPTADRAALYPGEGSARSAARYAGWRPDHTKEHGSGVLLCPACKPNPLGIVLPPDPVTGPERIVAYWSSSGKYLRCVPCHRATMNKCKCVAVTADELTDGGICLMCKSDVLA